jgi:hypothetical protein
LAALFTFLVFFVCDAVPAEPLAASEAIFVQFTTATFTFFVILGFLTSLETLFQWLERTFTIVTSVRGVTVLPQPGAASHRVDGSSEREGGREREVDG